MSNNKPCVKCGSVSRYPPSRGKTAGKCKACVKKYNVSRAGRPRHPRKTWPNNNKPCIKCEGTDRYKPKKGMRLGICKACSAKWQHKNLKKARAAGARYRAMNPEREKARTVKYRRENPEKAKASQAKYRSKNTERINAWSANRRALKSGAVGKHTATEWLAILARYDSTCLCCGATDNITKDHIVALDSGGTNWPENLQPLCGPCNSRKGTRHSTDYRPDMELTR